MGMKVLPSSVLVVLTGDAYETFVDEDANGCCRVESLLGDTL